MLYAMMSETERAVAEFKEDCKTDLTTRTSIRDCVAKAINVPINEAHLTHAIAEAGMIHTGRRIVSDDGKKHTVIIVKGNWTVGVVKAASPEALVEATKVEVM